MKKALVCGASGFIGGHLVSEGNRELQQEVFEMGQTGVTLTMEEIKTFVFRLPPLEFVQLADEMRERAEIFEMMCLAETGFAEWNEPGEDIYDHFADAS